MTSALNAGPNVVTINVDSYDGREHGEAVLNEVRHFLSRFVSFPTPAILDMVTLWVAHTHVVDGMSG
jgi:hypothetical protein